MDEWIAIVISNKEKNITVLRPCPIKLALIQTKFKFAFDNGFTLF